MAETAEMIRKEWQEGLIATTRAIFKAHFENRAREDLEKILEQGWETIADKIIISLHQRDRECLEFWNNLSFSEKRDLLQEGGSFELFCQMIKEVFELSQLPLPGKERIIDILDRY